MITFKQFLEDVKAVNGELLAAVNPSTSRSPSGETYINTNMRPLGKQTGTTRGETVFYAFSYHPSDTSTDLLKSFKGKGPFNFPDARRDKFLDQATSHMASEFKKMGLKPDVIVTPESSSSVTNLFAHALGDKLGVEAQKLSAFKKNTDTKITADKETTLAQIIKTHIDMEYFNQKYSGETKSKALIDLANQIRRSIAKNGYIVAKEIHKQDLKFVKNIVAPDLHDEDEYSLIDKDVMVIDDVLSSGGTMSDLFRACKELGAKSTYGCCLFARTAAAK